MDRKEKALDRLAGRGDTMGQQFAENAVHIALRVLEIETNLNRRDYPLAQTASTVISKYLDQYK